MPYGKKLQELGAENVLISMAGEGAVLITKHGAVYKKEAPEGKLVNGVGAGDSMVAGFMAGWLENRIMNMHFIWGWRQEAPVHFQKIWRQKQKFRQYMSR